VFLEVLFARSRKDECKSFLHALKRGDIRARVTDFTVHSIITLLAPRGKNELKKFLTSLLAYAGLEIYNTTLEDEIKAVDISGEKGLDIEDSIQYSAALTLGVKGIVSFDKHFDGLEIPRLEPGSIMPPK
jgi:predicted nucleic acid-binding protein